MAGCHADFVPSLHTLGTQLNYETLPMQVSVSPVTLGTFEGA